jgi:S-adenosylmethionine:tRNA ribosyltransferase-isomerase
LKKENLNLKAIKKEMNPKDISIEDFSYELPNEKIAKYPLQLRDQSKLLVYQNGSIRDHAFSEIESLIPTNGLLLINNTKVIHARILFHKNSGSQIEIFCLHPTNGDYNDAFNSKSNCEWVCMVGNAKRWKNETLIKEISFAGNKIMLEAHQIAQHPEGFKIRFSWNSPSVSFGKLLQYAGVLPIPPYLNREVEESDEAQYQTTYSKIEGSVAAPTAGLHFTEKVFENLRSKGVSIGELTLHVGAGTFKPVKAAKLEDHEMHMESIYVSLKTLRQLHQFLEEKKPIIAVGTTSLRTIESLYWFGVKLLFKKITLPELEVSQWDPYELPNHVSAAKAIETVILHVVEHNQQEISGSTQLLIAPSYQIKMANALVTNFHQPGSTLLLLVAAFVGDDWTKVYDHALTHEYRFLSFGDASLLFRG